MRSTPTIVKAACVVLSTMMFTVHSYAGPRSSDQTSKPAPKVASPPPKAQPARANQAPQVQRPAPGSTPPAQPQRPATQPATTQQPKPLVTPPKPPPQPGKPPGGFIDPAPNKKGVTPPPSSGPGYHPPAGTPPGVHEAGGGMAYHPNPNTTIHTSPNGSIQRFERPGLNATNFRPDGHAAHIERTMPDGARMTMNRGALGDRRIEVVRPGGVRVVAMGRAGFVERPLRPGFVARTYLIGGRTTVVVYRNYSYRGFAYVGFVPRVRYGPAFYGWAYRPWALQVVYPWGWGPGPVWFYGGYFAPYPTYTDPALWMTDYLLAANLQMAYDAQQQAQQQAAYQAPPPQAFTPEQMAVMKQMVANEVKQQLQADQAAAAQPAPVPSAAPVQPTAEAAPPALDPNQRTFIVAASVDATVDGGPCTLSGGDILYRSGDLGNDGKVGVTILNSKAGDCAANHTTAVELAALQDMHNQFRQQLASGMDTLASKQGQGGMPTSPPAGAVQLADGQATAAPDAQTLLAQINQQADQTETEIKQAAVGAPVGLLQPGNSRACTPARACD